MNIIPNSQQSPALFLSVVVFVPCFSAIDGLQECSQLFELPKGGAAFTG